MLLTGGWAIFGDLLIEAQYWAAATMLYQHDLFDPWQSARIAYGGCDPRQQRLWHLLAVVVDLDNAIAPLAEHLADKILEVVPVFWVCVDRYNPLVAATVQ